MRRISHLFVAFVVLSCLLLWGCGTTDAPSASEQKLAELTHKEEGGGPRPEFPSEAAAFWADRLQTPNGENPRMLDRLALEQIAARPEGGLGPPPMSFQSYGPGNFAGRLRGIAIQPTNTDNLLIGSVSGGIFKTTDGGASWAPVDDFLTSLAVGSMLVDPDDANDVWVGTGEGFFNFDAAQGLGIYKSEDFGDTFTELASTLTTDFQYVNRIGRIPGTNIVLAATRTGIHRSTDLGTSWTPVHPNTASSRGFTDLQVDPSDTTRIYAYHYGGGDATRRVYRSTNSGASFVELGAAEGIPTTNLSRMEIGIGTDGVVYLSVSNAATQTRGLWRSTAGGNAFVQTPSGTPFIERQGWYDLPIGVNPTDSDHVLMGAVDLFATTNAGTTITRSTFWNPGPGQTNQWIHADLHVIAFDPVDANTIYVGSDGGIYKSTDGGTNWAPLNNDIRITQYYGTAVHPSGDYAIGGTQDNGSHIYFGDERTWLEWFGGDGGYSAWDQQDPDFIYGSLPGGGLFGSSTGGTSAVQIGLPNTTGALFINPFRIDPNDGNRMIVGTDNIFFTSNLRNLNAASWTDVSGPLGQVSATTISPHDGDVALAGTTGGNIFMTTGLSTGGSWTNISGGISTSSTVTWIEVDPNDPTSSTLYATFASYGSDRVWRSTNAGGTWESIHGDLPDIPMFSLRVDPTDGARLFLGSELGLFVTESNEGGSFVWADYSYGMPRTRVVDLHWSGDDVLWAGTHGRSIYRIERSAAQASVDTVYPYVPWGAPVPLPIAIENDWDQTMTGVTVSLTSLYPGLEIVTGGQGYPNINVGESQALDFDVNFTEGDCGDVAQIQVDTTWAGGSGTEIVEVLVGLEPQFATGTLTEDAEDDETLFTTEAAVGDDDWTRTSTQANGGTFSWFSADVPSFADKSLLSPWFEANATEGGGSTVDMSIFYDMEGDGTQLWDGAVLEIRQAGGFWIDLGAAFSVAYDGQLFTNNTIPLRDAWSGVETTWRSGSVQIPAEFNGELVQLRLRVVCDTNTANTGFWVDDISVTNVTYPTALVCNAPFFADGFESGDTSRWSSVQP